MRKVKQLVRDAAVTVVQKIGTKIRDHESGELLGRALIVPWRGKIHIIGLDRAARPMFLPQKRLTYWKQELGFRVHPPIDFSNERSNTGAAADQR